MLAAFEQPARDSFADDQLRQVGVRARYHGHDRSVSDGRVVEPVNSSARIDDRGSITRRAHPAGPRRMVVVLAIGLDEHCDFSAGRDGEAGEISLPNQSAARSERMKRARRPTSKIIAAANAINRITDLSR